MSQRASCPAPPSSCQSTLAQLSLPMFPLAHSELLTVSGCLLTAMERGLMEFARAERKTGSSCRMRTQRLLVWPTIASMQDMRRQLTNRCCCSKTNYLSARTANASSRSALPLLVLLLQHIQRIPAPLHARNVHVVAKVSGQCGGSGQRAGGRSCMHTQTQLARGLGSFTGTDQDRPQWRRQRQQQWQLLCMCQHLGVQCARVCVSVSVSISLTACCCSWCCCCCCQWSPQAVRVSGFSVVLDF